jgi:hypothetical protein
VSGPRLSIIPAAAIEDLLLTPMALRALLYLGKHANTKSGWCRVRQKQMAKALGCAGSTLQIALALVVERGYAEMCRAGRPGGPAPDPKKQPYAAHAYRVRFDLEGVGGDDGIEVEDVVSDSCDVSPNPSGKGPDGVPDDRARGADPIASAPLERLFGNEAAATGVRASPIRPEAHTIADEIATLNGIDPRNPPPAWCGASMRVEIWLARGWTKETIMIGVKTVRARGADPPKRIEYFEGAIADAVAAGSKPLPERLGRSMEKRDAATQSPVTSAVREHLADAISFGKRPKGLCVD